jgi:ribonuclease D
MIIDTQSALADLIGAIASSEWIALDTEFMRERTYRAELCLVQIATSPAVGTAIATCVDPLALETIAPLAAPLASAKSRKVMHAARQDLEVLLPTVGLVGPVFDTQIAAGLAGFAPQIGYGELVRRLLDVELAKAHTRADWSRRPLSAEQIEYALDDVRHLIPLADLLSERLDRAGRGHWLEEDLRSLGDAATLAVQPVDAWRRLRGLSGLDTGRMRLLKSLAAWREQRASDRNRPRGWILDDIVLREIVARVPRTAEELARIPEMPEGVMRHCGDELLALIKAADVPNPPPPLPRREKPDPALTTAVKRMSEVVTRLAGELELAPELLATRRDLEQIAQGGSDAAPLQGWRKAVVGDALASALAAA